MCPVSLISLSWQLPPASYVDTSIKCFPESSSVNSVEQSIYGIGL